MSLKKRLRNLISVLVLEPLVLTAKLVLKDLRARLAHKENKVFKDRLDRRVLLAQTALMVQRVRWARKAQLVIRGLRELKEYRAPLALTVWMGLTGLLALKVPQEFRESLDLKEYKAYRGRQVRWALRDLLEVMALTVLMALQVLWALLALKVIRVLLALQAHKA
jgi:hypothetical protein